MATAQVLVRPMFNMSYHGCRVLYGKPWRWVDVFNLFESAYSMSYQLPVAEIMHPALLACAPSTSVREAAAQMVAAKCSSVLVMEADRILGIWTERDVLKIEDPQAFEQPIARVMSAPVKTVHQRTTVGDTAVRFHQEGIRHYVVVDDFGKPVGIVTQTDVVHSQGLEFYVQLRDVRSVQRQKPLFVPTNLSIADTAARMRSARQDAVVVAQDDGEYGIVTERDLLRFYSRQQQAAMIGEIATFPILSIPVTSSLYYARTVFAEHHTRHLGLCDENGDLVGLISYADILVSIEENYLAELQKALRDQQAELCISHQRLRLAEKVFETSLEGIMITSPEGIIESVNPGFAAITGYSLPEVLGKTPRVLQSGRHERSFYTAMWETLLLEGSWRGEVWNKRKNGEIYPQWLSISMVRHEDGSLANYVAIFSDISERKQMEERVRYLAHHDALTGLVNRTMFLEHLHRGLAHARRNLKMVGVMFLDLDGFKAVNDTQGHAAGDFILQEAACRLRHSVREDDVVARFGGDEFVILFEGITHLEHLAKIAGKIVHVLNEPFVFNQQLLRISTSIGVSLYPKDGVHADVLVQRADSAMYAAKRQGGSRFVFADDVLAPVVEPALL